MNTQITLFDQPTQLPTYLQTSEVAKQLASQVDGGLTSQSINRISLRNSKFRFNKEGVQVGVSHSGVLDVIVIAANPHVSRSYYEKAFDPDEAGSRPDCYSIDGRTPAEDAESPQSNSCALCPQNIAGSAKNGKGKACAYKKRLVVVAPDDILGDAFALDVAAMGLFGDDVPAQKQFNLKTYIDALKANGLIVPAVVTRLTFDDESTVPKLFFTPVRPLTAQEWAQVEQRVADPVIRAMLNDVDNKTEAGKPVGVTAPVSAPAIVAPVAAPAPAPAPAEAAPAPPRRGRKPAAETPPAQAPAPTAAPAAKGFGAAAVPAAAAPAAAPAAPAAPAGKGFTLDLDAFDA